MIVSNHITGLYDGVSQQATVDRFPTQCEHQENTLSRIADGATKRPPSRHLAKISDAPFGGAAVHTINRDLSERYTVVIASGDLKVFDAETGQPQPVTFPDGKTYLNSDNPASGFSMVSVADYTFIVNKSVITRMVDGDLTSGNFHGRKQEFYDVLQIDSPNNGDVYEVAGNEANSFGSYYVVRKGGVWRETVQPGIRRSFDASTLPHALVRTADGDFVFKQLDWADRDIGDTNTNPVPSFIDSSISDIYFFRNRLGVVSGDNVVMSRSGQYFNFWRETVTDLLDTDPIDVSVTGTAVASLNFAVPFNQTLMLFGGQQQYTLSAGQVLSPRTVSIDPATSFESSPDVRPVGLGPSVYFPVPAGLYASLMEYYVQDDAVSNDAADTTSHVPRYLPADIESLTAATNEDMVFLMAPSQANTVYVYRMHWKNDEKVQSSWNKWTVPGKVINLVVLENRLMILIERHDGVHLIAVDLRSDQVSGGLPYDVRFDMRAAIQGTYEAGVDETRFELPFMVEEGEDIQALLDTDDDSPVNITRLDGNLFSIPGNRQGVTAYFGFSYTQRHVFSRFYYVSGKTAVTTARVQLRRLYLTVKNTAFFKTNVWRNGVSTGSRSITPGVSKPFTGRTTGSTSWTVGEVALSDDEVSLPVRGNSQVLELELINDSPYPSQFVEARWIGEFNPVHRL